MPRVKKIVDKGKLQEEINAAEDNGPFPNLKALFVAVAKRKWAVSEGISFSVVGLRYAEFELTSKTKPGRVVEKKEPIKTERAATGTPQSGH